MRSLSADQACAPGFEPERAHEVASPRARGEHDLARSELDQLARVASGNVQCEPVVGAAVERRDGAEEDGDVGFGFGEVEEGESEFAGVDLGGGGWGAEGCGRREEGWTEPGGRRGRSGREGEVRRDGKRRERAVVPQVRARVLLGE